MALMFVLRFCTSFTCVPICFHRALTHSCTCVQIFPPAVRRSPTTRFVSFSCFSPVSETPRLVFNKQTACSYCRHLRTGSGPNYLCGWHHCRYNYRVCTATAYAYGKCSLVNVLKVANCRWPCGRSGRLNVPNNKLCCSSPRTWH